MSVLKRLKELVKEAQEDIEKSQKMRKEEISIELEVSKPSTQTSSEDKVEKIQKYRESVSKTQNNKKQNKMMKIHKRLK